jgi:hypothetical protein
MNNFPDACLRGLTKKVLTPENELSSDAFYPNEKTSDQRQDKGMELSINWEDEDKEAVIEITLKFFPVGYARLSRSAIDEINRLPGVNGSIIYERAPKENNPYHGNIVYKAGLSKPNRRAISASLTLACVNIVVI